MYITGLGRGEITIVLIELNGKDVCELKGGSRRKEVHIVRA